MAKVSPSSCWTCLSTLALLSLSVAACADAGTVMMQLAAFHLWGGNLVIGVLEGLLLGYWLRLRKGRSIKIMIAANYTSMIGGLITVALISLMFHGRLLKGLTVNNQWALVAFVAVGWLILYVMTVLIEWPFCHRLLRSASRRRSLGVSALVQMASYALLIPLYWMSGDIGVITHVQADPRLSFAQTPSPTVYYISENGSLDCISTNGQDRRQLRSLGVKNYAWLVVRRAKGSTRSDLWIMNYPKEDDKTLVLAQFADKASPSEDFLVRGDDEYHNDYSPTDLRAKNDRRWKVEHTDFWSGLPLQVHDTSTGRTLSVGFGTPFGNWHVSHATIVPGNQVVFEIEDQIVLLDPARRRIGLIARGHSPVVALDPLPIAAPGQPVTIP